MPIFFDDENGLDKERDLRFDRMQSPRTAPGQDAGESIFSSLGGGAESGGESPFSSGPPSSPFGNSLFGGAQNSGGDLFSGMQGGIRRPSGSLGGDSFASGPSFGGVPGLSSGSPFGRPGLGPSSPFGDAQQPGQQQEQKDIEDVILEGTLKGLKKSWNFFGQIIQLCKIATPTVWVTAGQKLTLFSGILTGIFSLMLIFSRQFVGPAIMAGTLLFTGFILQAVFLGKLEPKQPEQLVEEKPNYTESQLFDNDNVLLNLADSQDDDDEPTTATPDITAVMQNALKNNANTINFANLLQQQPKEQDVLDTLPAEANGLYTKSTLFEKFRQVLPSVRPDFNTKQSLPQMSELFLRYSAAIRRVGEHLKLTGSQQLDLQSVEVGFAADLLQITRPEGSNAGTIKQFDAQLKEVLDYDKETRIHNPRVQVMTEQSLDIWDTTVTKHLTPKEAMVSLRDALDQPEARDYMLDPENVFPILLGYDDIGSIIKTDLRDVESMLVVGKPRSGKTWSVLLMLAQLMLFNSPNEIQFYIADAKGKNSDFYHIRTPHVKKFVSETKDILSTLKYLCTVEANRRKEILANDGSANINVYNEKHPFEKMPHIYMIIDEMVSVAMALTDEESKEYNKLLKTIVTQLPSLGIKFIGIPHEIRHEYINKAITNEISFKILVCGDNAAIENTFGRLTGDNKFTYTLSAKGDQAIMGNILRGKLPVSGKPIFTKAFVLAKDNDTVSRLFKFCSDMWCKLTPEAMAGSRAEGNDDNQALNLYGHNQQLIDDEDDEAFEKVSVGDSAEDTQDQGFDDFEYEEYSPLEDEEPEEMQEQTISVANFEDNQEDYDTDEAQEIDDDYKVSVGDVDSTSTDDNDNQVDTKTDFKGFDDIVDLDNFDLSDYK